ncbi:hypothetical protein [Bacillus sp. V5-8f]|nr:hypothetical protein [Bacillus sp. V5-8f]
MNNKNRGNENQESERKLFDEQKQEEKFKHQRRLPDQQNRLKDQENRRA